MGGLVMAVVGGSMALSVGAADEVWAARAVYGDFVIVAGEERADRDAAAVLQRYWNAVTGHELPIVSEWSEGPAIFVGFDATPATYRDEVDPASFNGQEIWLKSYRDGASPLLVLAGGKASGTQYAVYQFLEDALGIRWIAPGVTHIPPAPDTIAPIAYRYDPVFEFRWSTFLASVDDRDGLQEYRDAHRWLPGPSFSAHTFYRYVPPEEYFEEHPEYFSLIDGKRVAPTYNWRDHNEHRNYPGQQGQLCMTNPEVLDVILARIEADIEANPSNTVHHISQMDWNYWCECEQCAAIDAREETHMGSVLWGLNRLAERLAEAHPDHRIETLAYTYTRKPPRYMKPHENVIIKLCSIECDFSRPFDDPASILNRAFAADIDAWSKIAARLHCWDYLTNFHNFQSPIPNFHTIQPNMQFLSEHRVTGMFPQGAYDDIAEFAPLRAYVVSKLLWNPYSDVQGHIDEFIALYYREAAPFVHDYIALLTDAQRKQGMPMTCFDRGLWYDYATVEAARSLFDRAFDAVESDEVRNRLKVLYTTVQYAAFKCPPESEITGDTIVVRRPESQTFDEYFAMVKGYGVKHINDYFALDSFVEQTRGETPARYRESPLITLENDRGMLVIAPELDGSVIRWRDKTHDLELFRAYTAYGKVSGSWEDWSTESGVLQRPVAPEYEVVDHTPSRVTLRARLDSGLTIERTLHLNDAGGVDLVLAISNEANKPLAPSVKTHPEFFVPGNQRPEIWRELNGVWSDLTANVRREEVAFGNIIAATGVTRLAAYLPDADVSVVCEIGSDAVEQLLYFFNVNPESKHVNLELLPDSTKMLAPGSRLEIKGTYQVVTGRPNPH